MTDQPIKPRNLAAHEKVEHAIDLRRDGVKWADVAAECGYADKATAYNAVKRAMQERRAELAEDIDDLRDRELDRLDYATRRVLEVMDRRHYATSGGKVVNGPDGEPLDDDGPVLAGATALVRISESRRRLLGLDAATKVEAAVAVSFTVQGIPEEEMP